MCLAGRQPAYPLLGSPTDRQSPGSMLNSSVDRRVALIAVAAPSVLPHSVSPCPVAGHSLAARFAVADPVAAPAAVLRSVSARPAAGPSAAGPSGLVAAECLVVLSVVAGPG